MFNKLRTKMRAKSFQLQLSLLFVIGFTSIVIAASISTSWLASRLITEETIKEGKTITRAFAQQSALALLTQSKENAAEAAEAILAFPHIKQVAIYEINHNLLYQNDKIRPWQAVAYTNQPHDAQLEFEDSIYWQFSAPVFLEGNYIEEIEFPFEEEASQQQYYGYVKVLISKEELNSVISNIVVGNISIIIFIAAILFFILQRLIRQMTLPLQTLAQTMHSAEEGEVNLRVHLHGSQELLLMSNAFNKMMAVLEEREAELTATRDQALESARIKSEFTANVSHELRTPMNGILGMLNLLFDSKLHEEQREYIKTARESSELLLRLINDILDFSKISAGQLVLDFNRFDLRAIIEGVTTLHANTDQTTEIEINCLFDNRLPKLVIGDEIRVRQLLNNIIGNAVKFTGLGEVTITTSLIKENEEIIWIKVDVTDTGIGIAKEDQAKIFASFSQRDSSSNREYGGAGLGLSIAKELVDLMHGTIDLESDTGAGSTFAITLPFKKATKENILVAPLDTKTPIANALLLSPPSIYLRVAETLCNEYHINHSWISEPKILHETLEDGRASGRQHHFLIINWPGNPKFIWKIIANIKETKKYEKLKIVQLLIPKQIKNLEAEEISISKHINLVLMKPLMRETVMNGFATILHELPSTHKKITKQEIKTPTFDKNSTRDKKILVVEDNDVNQRVILATLKKLGLSADLAKNGEVAVESVRRERYSLILMDCQMPVMNGYDATIKIREMESGINRIPILALTANASSEDKDKCLSCGMDDFIAKPFSIKKIAAVLSHWLKLKIINADENKNNNDET